MNVILLSYTSTDTHTLIGQAIQKLITTIKEIKREVLMALLKDGTQRRGGGGLGGGGDG